MIAIVIQAIQSVLIIICLIALGFILAKKGWFDERSERMIVNLVTKISLPIYMILGLLNNFTAERLIRMAPDLLVPLLSVFIAFICGGVLVRLFKISKGRRGVFWTNCFIANAVFIGLPVNLALFGEESMPSAMLYYIVNTSFFWTIGVYLIIKDSDNAEAAIFSLGGLKKIISPPFLGFVLGIILVLSDVKLPTFIQVTGQYIGNLTTPLSLMFVGIEISKVALKDLHFDFELWGSLIGRFIICPLGVLVLIPFIPITEMSMKVFTLQAAMPAMTQVTIISSLYGADSKYAARLTFVTIVLSLLVIPIYMVVVNCI